MGTFKVQAKRTADYNPLYSDNFVPLGWNEVAFVPVESHFIHHFMLRFLFSFLFLDVMSEG